MVDKELLELKLHLQKLPETVGVGNSFLDNVYFAEHISVGSSIVRVFANVNQFQELTQLVYQLWFKFGTIVGDQLMFLEINILNHLLSIIKMELLRYRNLCSNDQELYPDKNHFIHKRYK